MRHTCRSASQGDHRHGYAIRCGSVPHKLFRGFDYSDEVPLKPEGGNRHYTIKRPLEERVGNFKEINLGYTKEQAYAEASRCLRCDVRVTVNTEEE